MRQDLVLEQAKSLPAELGLESAHQWMEGQNTLGSRELDALFGSDHPVAARRAKLVGGLGFDVNGRPCPGVCHAA